MTNRTSRGFLAAAATVAALLALQALPAHAQVDIFGFHHTPVGGATLTANPAGPSLEVNNIGSSGNDGVSIDLGSISLTQFEFETSFGDLGPPESHAPGMLMRQSTFGTIAGGPRQSVSKLSVQSVGSDYQYTLDFTPSSTDPVTVNYFLGGPTGALVAQEVIGGGLVDGIQARMRFELSFSFDKDGSLINFDIRFGSGSALRTAGGSTIVADYLVAYASQPLGFDGYTDVQYTAGGDITSFSITGETVTAVPEPSSFALLAIGAAGLLFYARGRRKLAA